MTPSERRQDALEDDLEVLRSYLQSRFLSREDFAPRDAEGEPTAAPDGPVELCFARRRHEGRRVGEGI